MKKTALFFALLLYTITFSQIKVLKYETEEKIGESNAVSIVKMNKKYTITYQDINTSAQNTYRSFSFEDLDRAYDQLYQIIVQGLKTLPKSDIKLDLPNDIIFLHFEKNVTKNIFQFTQFINKSDKAVGKSPFLTLKDVDKIFNRNNASYTAQNYDQESTENKTNNTSTGSKTPAPKKVVKKKAFK